MEYFIHFEASHFFKKDRLERVHRRATKVRKGLENKTCEGILKELGMLSLEKIKTEGIHNCLQIY